VFVTADGQTLAFVRANVDVAAMVARVQARVRRRVLAAQCRHGVLREEDANGMATWDHGGGFWVDASVGIVADDRPALARLLRYCARPCWASERLTQADDGERLIYLFDKPRPDGKGYEIQTPFSGGLSGRRRPLKRRFGQGSDLRERNLSIGNSNALLGQSARQPEPPKAPVWLGLAAVGASSQSASAD